MVQWTLKPTGNLLVLLLFLALAGYLVWVSAYRPYHNWDMVMYIAAAKSFEERDIQSLHKFSYDQLRQSVSETEYKGLVEGNQYIQAVSVDPAVFAEQLPFYQIRPLYTGAIYLLYKAGIDMGFATHVISGVAVGVAVILLYLMAVPSLRTPFILMIPLLCLFDRAEQLANHSTPDGLAFLAIILSAYIYATKRITLLLVVLPVILCVRTDLILFTVPLLGSLWLLDKEKRTKVSFSLILSGLVYIMITHLSNNAGWSTVFYFTFIQNVTHPLSMPPILTVQNYFFALGDGTIRLLRNPVFLFYGLLSVWSLFEIWRQVKRRSGREAFHSPWVVLSLVCLLYVLLHFLLFPVTWVRFYAGEYMIGAVSLFALLSDQKEMRQLSQTPVQS